MCQNSVAAVPSFDRSTEISRMNQHQQTPLTRLLDRARNGDEDARNLLFEKCRNYLNFVARAQVEGSLRAKVDASDIVQQTMLEAHQAFEQFQGESEHEWMAWLRKILTNNATDFVRHFKGTQKRRATLERPIAMGSEDSLRFFAREPSDPGQTPSQLVIQKENEIELADAISQLSPDHQEVIMLRNLQRLPFDEVAERMNRTRPAAQMLWMRAIKRLQQILKADAT